MLKACCAQRGWQCDQMAVLLINLWPFTTMKMFPVA